jgi:hypothetical protein
MAASASRVIICFILFPQVGCLNNTDILTTRLGESAPAIKNPAAGSGGANFSYSKRGNYESGMQKLKLLLLWDLDLFVFIIIVLLASKSLSDHLYTCRCYTSLGQANKSNYRANLPGGTGTSIIQRFSQRRPRAPDRMFVK